MTLPRHDIDFTKIAMARYSCKAFDPAKKIPTALFDQLKTLMRLSPSSVNSQPWHYIVADDDKGKGRIAKGTEGDNSYNTKKILDCSHALVFCRHLQMNQEHQNNLLDADEKAGRLKKPEERERQKNIRSHYFNEHLNKAHDMQAWTEKQIYLSYGMVLLAAASLGIDACPIEGFDKNALDRELKLADRGLASVVLMALGYRLLPDDFNATMPKARLTEEMVFTKL